MASNAYQSQLVGPFEAGHDLFSDIKENALLSDFEYVKHLGIQTRIGSIVQINGEDIEIGKTGIYEIGNTKVTSIVFTEDVDKNTIVEYTIE